MAELYNFGLIGDVQAADFPDCWNTPRDRIRFYRNSISHLDRALKSWTEGPEESRVKFILQAGDLLDGRCDQSPGMTEKFMRIMEDKFSQIDVPTHHLVGNHELYVLSRAQLEASFLNSGRCHGDAGKGKSPQYMYYSCEPVPGLRLICLDGYLESVLGWPETSEEFQKATKTIRAFNPHENLNNIKDVDPPYMAAFNGALGEQQRQWLETTLQKAQLNKENVIVS